MQRQACSNQKKLSWYCKFLRTCVTRKRISGAVVWRSSLLVAQEQFLLLWTDACPKKFAIHSLKLSAMGFHEGASCLAAYGFTACQHIYSVIIHTVTEMQIARLHIHDALQVHAGLLWHKCRLQTVSQSMSKAIAEKLVILV